MRLLTEKIRSKHLNIVRLIGNVVSEVKSSSSNVKFNFRTYDKDNFHATHKVVVPSFVMKNCPISIEKDQKLFINGKLTLIDFIRDNGKKGTIFKVLGLHINQIDNGEVEDVDDIDCQNNVDTERTFEVNDQNRVILESIIWTKIQNEDKFSFFSVANGRSKLNDEGCIQSVFDFIPIFAYDEKLRNTLKNQLNRLDRVRIEGFLRYKQCFNQIGEAKSNGYVEATRITKLIPICNTKK